MSYLYYSLLFSMYDASGGCGHHRDVHDDDAWRRQGSNFGDGGRSAVSLTFSSSRHHATVIITCHLVAVAIVNDRAE